MRGRGGAQNKRDRSEAKDEDDAGNRAPWLAPALDASALGARRSHPRSAWGHVGSGAGRRNAACRPRQRHPEGRVGTAPPATCTAVLVPHVKSEVGATTAGVPLKTTHGHPSPRLTGAADEAPNLDSVRGSGGGEAHVPHVVVSDLGHVW